jgi:PAT family beta-lactamase induction signal transducer AmpG
MSFWTNPLGTRRSRLATFFLLYVSEGIPLGFTASVIALHMRREGLDPADIGWYVGSLYLPWAFKWVMGPIVDTITSRRFGPRRTWIVGAQAAMTAFLLFASPIDFTTSLKLFTAVIFLHNICAAAQDVAIDALAVQTLQEDERGTANGVMFAGQGIGQALGGSGILLLTDYIPFGTTYFIAAALITLILFCVSWRIRESASAMLPRAEGDGSKAARIVADIRTFAIAARNAFVSTRASRLGVILALLPLGAYSLSLSLSSNIAVELGLTDNQLGRLGLGASVLSALGCVTGGVLSDRFGRRRMLALFVVLTALPALYLAFAMSAAGYVMPLAPEERGATSALILTFVVAGLAHSFVQGLTYGSSSALYMDITTPAVAATQFTAYMALANLVTFYTAGWQGESISRFGYPTTLGLDAAAGLLCLFVLPWMATASTRPRTEEPTTDPGAGIAPSS